ncbi:hypothetical protein NIES2100_26050 [Calothrix sp. NIES-2100]|uniref:hypothetical protein n=1 Tax=Calothrix sp. NIES-2100 TaxID=1954172 RepID=UPI000B620559|nr:hypothetical protein NIES2100_26050 [Calothrix sp. NIES-2100]
MHNSNNLSILKPRPLVSEVTSDFILDSSDECKAKPAIANNTAYTNLVSDVIFFPDSGKLICSIAGIGVNDDNRYFKQRYIYAYPIARK